MLIGITQLISFLVGAKILNLTKIKIVTFFFLPSVPVHFHQLVFLSFAFCTQALFIVLNYNNLCLDCPKGGLISMVIGFDISVNS